jgi:hypothetical protein
MYDYVIAYSSRTTPNVSVCVHLFISLTHHHQPRRVNSPVQHEHYIQPVRSNSNYLEATPTIHWHMRTRDLHEHTQQRDTLISKSVIYIHCTGDVINEHAAIDQATTKTKGGGGRANHSAAKQRLCV